VENILVDAKYIVEEMYIYVKIVLLHTRITMNKSKIVHQGIKQRIGKLVEGYVCNKHGLSFNRKQQTRGFYDAYNKDNIFEIKAIKAIKNQDTRITIFKKNHLELLKSGCGKYIFVNYDLINKDKNLQLIQDVNILHEIVLPSEEINALLIDYGVSYNRNFRGHIKEYIRLKFSYILELYNDNR
jgi:hypothetical protein